jgi:predicted MFS family arabinose efflux permease
MLKKGLWQDTNFLKLWASETISVFGSAVGNLAYSLLAAVTLNATPTQMGILNAANMVPWLLVGLFAGVWVDRFHRRPILIITNLGRAVLVGIVPVLMFFDLLTIEYLYIFNFLYGVLTVFFEIAYQSFLPSLVKREDLPDGNGKLETSRSAAQIAGPGLGGLLIQYLGIPLAIIIDALSFLASALLMLRITKPEPHITATQRKIIPEVLEGLASVFRNIYLRSNLGYIFTLNFGFSMMYAVYILFLTRELKFEPAAIGLVYAASGPGALLGAIMAVPLAKRFGIGPTLIGAALASGLAMVLTPLAGGPYWLAIGIIVVGQFLESFIMLIYNVNGVSLRQAVTPQHLMGRTVASMRFLTWGINPVGSILGGLLGEWIGLRGTIWISVVISLTGFLWLWFSPVRQLRQQLPALPDESDTPAPATPAA